MSDLDIDRIIDRAAEGLVMGEPSRSLGAVVRDRVTARSRPRRLAIWAPGAAAIAAALFVVVFITSSGAPPKPVGIQQTREVTSTPAAVQDVPPTQSRIAAERPALRAERIPKAVPRQATIPGPSVDVGESVTFESIEPSPIELDDIIIDPLIVEPLTN